MDACFCILVPTDWSCKLRLELHVKNLLSYAIVMATEKPIFHMRETMRDLLKLFGTHKPCKLQKQTTRSTTSTPHLALAKVLHEHAMKFGSFLHVVLWLLWRRRRRRRRRWWWWLLLLLLLRLLLVRAVGVSWPQPRSCGTWIRSLVESLRERSPLRTIAPWSERPCQRP